MDEKDLLRRFAALKGAPLAPLAKPAQDTAPGPSRHVGLAARRAQQEDEDLERIADGRPLDLRGDNVYNDDEDATESRWNDVRGQAERARAEDDALRDRLKGLGGQRWTTMGVTEVNTGSLDDLRIEDEGDDEVEAYIASLQNAASPTVASQQQLSGEAPADNALRRPVPDSADDLERLRREAADLITMTRVLIEPGGRSDQDGAESPNGLESRTDQVEDGDEDANADGETEQEILERALAEAELEREEELRQKPPAGRGGTSDRGPTRTPAEAEQVAASHAGDDVTNDDPDSSFSFPSIPTAPPIDTPTDDVAGDSDLDARMRLLAGLSGPTAAPLVRSGPNGGLPSVPSAKPGQATNKDERQVGQGWNLPGWADGRDDDLDSWCCICNKDATLICGGCDGDLYCDECWRDGHGPGGEQGHRAKRFNWTQKKRLVGAQ